MFLRFVVAVSLLLSSTASAQAVMRPAPYRPPPAYTPGYAPGTPAEPVYAPGGAGVPGERVPGTVAPAVPRSEGRMLPRTDEPGVWAADGATRAMVLEEVPRILGEVLPFHETATTDKEKHLTRVCAYKMNEALVGMDLMKHALKLPPKDRSCLAGWLYEHCVRTMRESYDEAEAAGIYSLEHKTRIRSTQRAAEAFKKAKCDGVALSREAEAIAQDVENATAHRSVDP